MEALPSNPQLEDPLVIHSPPVDGDLQVRVNWQSFDVQDDTWEFIATLLEDIPGLLRNFAKARTGESPRMGELYRSL